MKTINPYKVGMRVFDHSPQNMGNGKIIKVTKKEISIKYTNGEVLDYVINSEDLGATIIYNFKGQSILINLHRKRLAESFNIYKKI